MARNSIQIALISDVFFDRDPASRLAARLKEARERGAELAILPEIPCNPWSPATTQRRDDDAESPGGPRAQMQAEAARTAGIGLVGGAIVRDPATSRRHNTSLVFDAGGRLVAAYAKLHIPEEPGFWETSHYDAGTKPPQVIEACGLRFGVQICSDINRPEGCHLLGAMGAEAVLAPRATEQRTYPRWKVVFQANALTSCCYVLSVNRPGAEQGVLIGGPSIATGPDGQVLLETTEPVGVVSLDLAALRQARSDYPGYLPVRADLYAQAWSDVARQAPAAVSGYPARREAAAR